MTRSTTMPACMDALRAKRDEAWARAYEADAAIDRFYGDTLAAEFHEAMAAVWRNEPDANERKERAYVVLQARRVLNDPECMKRIAEADRPAVAAEVDVVDGEIRHCPLHGAAPRLYAALTALADPEGHIPHGAPGAGCTGECRDAMAAIAEVEMRREAGRPLPSDEPCIHVDDDGPFFAKCGKCGAVLDDFAGGD